MLCYSVCSSNPRSVYSYITVIIYRFIQVDFLSSQSVKVIVNIGSFEMIKLLRWEKVQSYFTNIYGFHVTFSEL